MGAIASPHKMAIQEHFLLAFGVDSFFFRRASADAAANVLEHLGSLEIIRVTLKLGGAPRGGIGWVELLGLVLRQSKRGLCVLGPIIRHERH